MKINPDKTHIFSFFVAFFFTAVQLLFSQNLKYQLPPKKIAEIVDAPLTPAVDIGPNQEWMLILGRSSLPSIEEVAQPELRIAGIRINPATNGPSRSRYYCSISTKNIYTDKQVKLNLPEKAKISNINWSPDGEKIAFTLTIKDRIELWLGEIASGKTKKLMNQRLNDAYGTPYHWLSDSKTIVCLTVPDNRNDMPSKPLKPKGPVVQENLGKTAPARTYQDLLKNPYDESLFEYFLTSQIIKVTLKGKIDPIGKAAIYSRIYPSPNGKYFLVEKIHRPYSYIVPAYRFPKTVEVWDKDAELIYQVAEIPLTEEIPIGFNAVQTGRRSISWRADSPATLYWVEAQDDGDPNKKAKIRDKVFMLSAPFKGKPIPVISLSLRYSYINWGSGKIALVTERWWRTRKTKTWLFAPDSPGSKAKLLFDRSYEDRYSDPGRFVSKPNKYGRYVLMNGDNGKTFFLIGNGASPNGDHPFLDKLNLKTLKPERIWQSKDPYYEQVVSLISNKGTEFILRRESKTDVPNYYLKKMNSKELKQLTAFPHPAPQLKNVQKEIIKYNRDDGVQLTATLYLPEGYKTGDGPLPVIMWAYPREFKSARAAGQMRGSQYQFIRVSWSSPILWLTQGYAILSGPTMPIIGEGDKEPNDTYVEQLVASAKAAIDELVRRGVADPERIAIGGHSYGAFMTANLLAHSDLFAAGIARSGAYNRTLTPFGFQSEERTYWQAPDVYFNMSPFMHAPKVNEPILLIHGEADNNSGTFPLQSRRYYHALKGLGATARLVFLPHESHGYRARESVMHVLWEQNEWLEKYVKKAGKK